MTSIEFGRYTQTAAIPGTTVIDRVARARRNDRACRALNVCVALTALFIAAPLMLVIALLIRLTSRGPVLYVQTRVGVDRRRRNLGILNHRRKADGGGRPFTIYKFRTMRVDGHSYGQVWARPDDPRITGIGRILRKYRLDELPQFFNVLLGDMNLVGPRPEQPKIFAELRGHIDRYHERQRILPGITGLAQIRHRYDSSVEDVKTKLAFDLEYLERRSLWQDLKIMLRTVPVMVLRKGAL